MNNGKKQIGGKYNRRIHHGDFDSHDLCLSTRKTTRISLNKLSNLWGDDLDVGQKYLALFLLYNKPSFDFLSINAFLDENGTSALIFQSAEKVGCAPLYSPITGKVCASIIIKGNMNEDISEILPLIENDIEVSFSDKLPLPFKQSIKPPMYFECAKYIDQYTRTQKLHWKKFISKVRIEHTPAASTRWDKYATKSFDPNETFKYPNKKNLLSTEHLEWRELNYVLKMSLDELCSAQTPRTSRLSFKDKIDDLRRKTDFRDIVKPTELKIHAADPLEIKTLKKIGNRILSSISSEYRAWSIDFSKLFECYVQRVFTTLAKQIGARTINNNKFVISGVRCNWGLAYLEPDIIITKGNQMIVVDAKYKMHMYNTMSEKAESLKESFRHDLHQVLAYSSFENNTKKTAILVYPSNTFKCLRQRISAPNSSCSCNIYLVGIPWGNIGENESHINTPMSEKLRAATNGLYEYIFKSNNL